MSLLYGMPSTRRGVDSVLRPVTVVESSRVMDGGDCGVVEVTELSGDSPSDLLTAQHLNVQHCCHNTKTTS